MVKFDPKPFREKRVTPSEGARYQDPWIPYPAGIDAMQRMARMIGAPHMGRPKCLAIVGEPNFGKSHLLDHFTDNYPDLPSGNPNNPDDTSPRIQTLLVDTPPKADGSSLLRTLLRAIGASFNTRSPPDELLRLFVVRAQSLQILMIIIDEFSNGAWGRKDAAQSLVQTVRAITTATQRPLVIAGTPKLDEVLRNDAQLSKRFKKLHLPSWSTLRDLQDLLASFETRLDMPQPSNLGSPATSELILELCGTSLGDIAEVVREARDRAIESGSPSIKVDHIRAAADYVTPKN